MNQEMEQYLRKSCEADSLSLLDLTFSDQDFKACLSICDKITVVNFIPRVCTVSQGIRENTVNGREEAARKRMASIGISNKEKNRKERDKSRGGKARAKQC